MALAHHILPDSGWISFRIKKEKDIEHTILLFRISYIRYLGMGKIKPDFNPQKEIDSLNISEDMKSILRNNFVKSVE